MLRFLRNSSPLCFVSRSSSFSVIHVSLDDKAQSKKRLRFQPSFVTYGAPPLYWLYSDVLFEQSVINGFLQKLNPNFISQKLELNLTQGTGANGAILHVYPSLCGWHLKGTERGNQGVRELDGRALHVLVHLCLKGLNHAVCSFWKAKACFCINWIRKIMVQFFLRRYLGVETVSCRLLPPGW